MFDGCTSLSGDVYLRASNITVNDAYILMFRGCTGMLELHFPKSFEDNETFIAMSGAPKFGATNATVHYDL